MSPTAGAARLTDEYEAFAVYWRERQLSTWYLDSECPADWGLAFKRDAEAAWQARAALSPIETTAGVPISDEPELRRMLCASYAGAEAYMDDGEAQDNREQPLIDFLRDPIEQIKHKMFVRASNAAHRLAASPVQKAEPPDSSFHPALPPSKEKP